MGEGQPDGDSAVGDAIARDTNAVDGDTAPLPIVIHNAEGVTSIGNQSALTRSFTVPAVSNRMLLVGAGCDIAASIPSAEFAGKALPRAVERIGAYGSSALFYLIDPPAGTADLVVTFPNGQATLRGLVAVVLEGVEPAPPEKTSAHNTNTSPITTTQSVLTDGAVVVDLVTALFTTITSKTGLPSAANSKQQVLHIVDFGNGFTPAAMSAVLDNPIGDVQLGWSFTSPSAAVVEMTHLVVTIAPSSGR